MLRDNGRAKELYLQDAKKGKEIFLEGKVKHKGALMK